MPPPITTFYHSLIRDRERAENAIYRQCNIRSGSLAEVEKFAALFRSGSQEQTLADRTKMSAKCRQDTRVYSINSRGRAALMTNGVPDPCKDQ